MEWSYADIIKEPIDTDFDHVTSRIMWLDGLEEGLNKGEGIDSRKRFIYNMALLKKA